jgi:hypothetical protein
MFRGLRQECPMNQKQSVGRFTIGADHGSWHHRNDFASYLHPPSRFGREGRQSSHQQVCRGGFVAVNRPSSNKDTPPQPRWRGLTLPKHSLGRVKLMDHRIVIGATKAIVSHQIFTLSAASAGRVGNQAFSEIAGEGSSQSIAPLAMRTPLPSHANAG